VDAGAAAPAGPWADRALIVGPDGVIRCAWGVEGAQAGLSWSTIPRKRDGYRRAFSGFDASAVAGLGEADVARLLADPGIVRNRRKVESAIASAEVIRGLAESGESFVGLLWGFVGGVPLDRRPANMGEIRAAGG